MLSAASWPAVPSRGRAAERLADAGLVAFAAGLGALSSGYQWHAHGELLDAADLAAGGPACLALWWRRALPRACASRGGYRADWPRRAARAVRR